MNSRDIHIFGPMVGPKQKKKKNVKKQNKTKNGI